jgi:hypothetical protein
LSFEGPQIVVTGPNETSSQSPSPRGGLDASAVLVQQAEELAALRDRLGTVERDLERERAHNAELEAALFLERQRANAAESDLKEVRDKLAAVGSMPMVDVASPDHVPRTRAGSLSSAPVRRVPSPFDAVVANGVARRLRGLPDVPALRVLPRAVGGDLLALRCPLPDGADDVEEIVTRLLHADVFLPHHLFVVLESAGTAASPLPHLGMASQIPTGMASPPTPRDRPVMANTAAGVASDTTGGSLTTEWHLTTIDAVVASAAAAPARPTSPVDRNSDQQADQQITVASLAPRCVMPLLTAQRLLLELRAEQAREVLLLAAAAWRERADAEFRAVIAEAELDMMVDVARMAERRYVDLCKRVLRDRGLPCDD